MTEQPSEDRVLVGAYTPQTYTLTAGPAPNPASDVREPSEYNDGYIPGAINLPIKSQPDALFLPSHEFEDRFGFEKPSADQEVVFYCKSGVRSSAAAQMAQQLGYTKVAEYRGSWLDWQKNNGPASKP